MIVAYLVPDNDASVTAGTNYTLIDGDSDYGNPSFPEYWIQTTASATNGSFTSDADDFPEGCVAFRSASSSSSPAWTRIQGGSTASASQVTSLTLTLPSNPGVGRDVLVGIEFDSGSSVPVSNVSVHDANGNWYTMSPHSPFLDPRSGKTESLYFFYLLNAPWNAGQTLYVNWTTAIDAVAWADEFSSSSGAAAFDTDTGAVNVFPDASINLPSITPAGSNQLLYALTLQCFFSGACGWASLDHGWVRPAVLTTQRRGVWRSTISTQAPQPRLTLLMP